MSGGIHKLEFLVFSIFFPYLPSQQFSRCDVAKWSFVRRKESRARRINSIVKRKMRRTHMSRRGENARASTTLLIRPSHSHHRTAFDDGARMQAADREEHSSGAQTWSDDVERYTISRCVHASRCSA